MTKEEILTEFCESDHPARHTYIDIENDVIDGRATHVLAAMERYAADRVREAIAWERLDQLPCPEDV